MRGDFEIDGDIPYFDRLCSLSHHSRCSMQTTLNHEGYDESSPSASSGPLNRGSRDNTCVWNSSNSYASSLRLPIVPSPYNSTPNSDPLPRRQPPRDCCGSITYQQWPSSSNPCPADPRPPRPTPSSTSTQHHSESPAVHK